MLGRKTISSPKQVFFGAMTCYLNWILITPSPFSWVVRKCYKGLKVSYSPKNTCFGVLWVPIVCHIELDLCCGDCCGETNFCCGEKSSCSNLFQGVCCGEYYLLWGIFLNWYFLILIFHLVIVVFNLVITISHLVILKYKKPNLIKKLEKKIFILNVI